MLRNPSGINPSMAFAEGGALVVQMAEQTPFIMWKEHALCALSHRQAAALMLWRLAVVLLACHYPYRPHSNAVFSAFA